MLRSGLDLLGETDFLGLCRLDCFSKIFLELAIGFIMVLFCKRNEGLNLLLS